MLDKRGRVGGELAEEMGGVSVQTFGCVWDALADTPGEAACLRLRSDLMSAVQQAVADWGVSPAAAARRLRVTRPRLGELLHGRMGRFSFDELVQLAIQAGLEVRVQVQAVAG